MSALSNENSLGGSFRREAELLRQQKTAKPGFKELVFGKESASVANIHDATNQAQSSERAAAPKQTALTALQVRTFSQSGPQSFFAKLNLAWGDALATANVGRLRTNDEVSVAFVSRSRFPGTNTCELSVTLQVTAAGMKIIEQDKRCSVADFQFFPLRPGRS